MVASSPRSIAPCTRWPTRHNALPGSLQAAQGRSGGVRCRGLAQNAFIFPIPQVHDLALGRGGPGPQPRYIALPVQEGGQGGGYVRAAGAKSPRADGHGAPSPGFATGIAAAGVGQPAEVVAHGRHVGMVGTEGPLGQTQGPLIQPCRGGKADGMAWCFLCTNPTRQPPSSVPGT
jgi:hypothetical protein